MKEILLIARNNYQCDEWFRYLDEHISSVSRLGTDISTKEYCIRIRPNSKKWYRGRRPDYHYAYRLEADRYLLDTGSKRLRSLDDVIDIVQKEKTMEEMRRVMFSDEDHVWIDGNKQFISLKRFFELRDVMDKECRLLMDKIKELSKENKAMKVLLNIK